MALPTVAGNTSSTLAQYPTVYYDRKAVTFLRNNLHFYECIEKKPMPEKSGVAMQIFGYTKLAANTTAATEGTPAATGAVLTASTGTITLSQYVDWVTYSDKAILTNISPVAVEGAELLAYRGALTVDSLINTAVDAAAAADSAGTQINLAHTTYMTASINRKSAMLLRSVDAKPQANGLFKGVISSLLIFDLINDSNAGGFQDAFRYIDPKALQNSVDANTQRVAVIGGVEWFESNALPTVGNFQSTGVNGYRGYVFGKDAFFGASLAMNDLGQRNFKVMTREFAMGQNSLDPGGLIGAASVYKFYFGVSKRPQGVNVFKRITAESTIG
jgi:N4-gp56 family major capsid protein